MKDMRKIEGKCTFTKALAAIGALLLALVLTLTSCGSSDAATGDAGSGSAETTAASAETKSNAASKSEMFTERDLSADYDESSAVSIELSGSSAKTNSNNGVSVDGGTVTITKEGTYIVSGTISDGQIIVDSDDTAKVQIVLKEASITSMASAAVYVKSADKVFITTAKGTNNTLTNGGSFTAVDDSNIDGAVFAKDDITFNGSGSLTIESPAGHGVVGKDDVKIAGGTVTINAENHGIQANDSVRIAEADVNITAGLQTKKDGIHVDDGGYESGTSSESYFYMADGTLTINTGDDGIHSENEVNIEGGTIDITESYEAIEGVTIKVSGGDIKVKATDDGFNAAGGNSSSGSGAFGSDDFGGGGKGGFGGGTNGTIDISGGSIYITAGGDGVDSNGAVNISGGYTVVCGPVQGDTSVLDYNSTATITGGTFIGTGASGMAENFSTADGQGVITVSTGNQSAGTTVTLKDASGKTVAEVTPDLDYNVVYISTPDVQTGSTYTLEAGSYSETIEMNESIYSSITGGMGGRGGMGGGMRGNESGAGDRTEGQNNDGMQGGRMHGPGGKGQANNADTNADAISGASEMSSQTT